MTSEAQAVVRRFLELAAVRDRAGIADHLDPNVVWFGTRGGLDAHRVHRGPPAVLDYLQEVGEPWERLDVETERLIEFGDTVVAFLRETARARQSDLPVRSNTAMNFRVRGQKILEMRGYLDRDEALRAARLREGGSDHEGKP